MKKKHTKIFTLCLIISFIFQFSLTTDAKMEKEIITAEIYTEPQITKPRIIEVKVLEKEDKLIFDEDVQLIALITMGEAEGECEEGKRLVIDTILNRVDSEHFPDTVYDVIYQPNQFSCIWNGRLERVEVTDEICQLVVEEMEYRKNNDVLFFTAGNYGQYGEPLFQVGNHCFSQWKGE